MEWFSLSGPDHECYLSDKIVSSLQEEETSL